MSRAPSVWDVFSHAPGNIKGGATGDVACDHYHLYKEDFKLMRDLGIKHYRWGLGVVGWRRGQQRVGQQRAAASTPLLLETSPRRRRSPRFSIAWPRILLDGGRKSPINPGGVAFYNALLDEMEANGIEPAATMFHCGCPSLHLHAPARRINGSHGPDCGGCPSRPPAVCFDAGAAAPPGTVCRHPQPPPPGPCPGAPPNACDRAGDLPQSLHDKYKGPLSPEFVDDFEAYADALFRAFPRIKNWMVRGCDLGGGASGARTIPGGRQPDWSARNIPWPCRAPDASPPAPQTFNEPLITCDASYGVGESRQRTAWGRHKSFPPACVLSL